ncbi:MAG: hypothetical protein LBK47_06015 [Prevotellaceae bacterium]|nr:hypothetical protein [Prevotellaceae bacterium]
MLSKAKHCNSASDGAGLVAPVPLVEFRALIRIRPAQQTLSGVSALGNLIIRMLENLLSLRPST